MSSSQDLMQRIASAGARMDPGLSGRAIERLIAGARQRRRRRRARRMALAGVGACALVVTLVMMAHRRLGAPEPVLAAKPQPPVLPVAGRVVRLADGSTATALDPATEIAVAEDKNDHAALVLTRGRGRFDVKPRPTRAFVVHVGNVTITVMGTRFTVERVADRVGVAVERGTVRVDWGVGSAVLQEDASGWYPPLMISGPGDRSSSQDPTARSRTAPSGTPSLAPSSSPAAAKRETAGDLLVAADNARLSGHGEQAEKLLRRVLRDHRNDSRAPLAAFTLGRMLLRELGRPTEAAAVFADARRLSPRGPFAEDALAREVEAHRRAGAVALARSRAEEYLRLYPNGRRAVTVRAMGGIE
ncbi:MAG: FecR domain-containing protein [Polyangiaceae bacterium]|nr:FecR domain-containing protein [Polyangiaceae bacterium]